MAKNAIALLALVLAAGGCAGMSRSATVDQPSASIPDTSVLAGRWTGSIYETAGSLVSGSTPLDVTIAPDGTWRGTIGKAAAAGRVQSHGRRVVLEGTAGAPDGPARPVYLDLKSRGDDLWGQTVATFSGRDDRAAVALERVQS